jgi:type III secretion protein R
METTPLLFGLAAGFSLFAFVAMTAFIKLSVVFMIIRQALGLQQVPSNMILMALAVFLSAYISKPVVVLSIANMADIGFELENPETIFELVSVGLAPFQSFMLTAIDPNYLDFLVDITTELWAGSGVAATHNDIMIQIPAFMISELTEAFKIGFLLYLPFVAIDLAVTGILMALGMQMVQPNIIAVPFKLLTFVFVDGWAQLVEGLILTYTG